MKMANSSIIPIKFLILVALANICVSQDFDFFYFVQQWPGSSCDTKQGCCFPQTGKPASNFTVHGLWPNFNNGSFPSNCKSVENSFDESKMSDIVPRAETSWAAFSCPSKKKTNSTNSDNMKLWKHEWDKHGTCSHSVLHQHAYFDFTLNLKDHIDLLQILLNNGIKPDGKNYSVEKIRQVIKEATGFEAGIRCNTDASGNSQLNEIVLCVDKSAASRSFIECPILPDANCPDNVEFPIF
ncbi:hypothetical protein HN51_037750 [Arachis hypogaea]|uniref:ribonuclease 1-like n=1 Tax=Arachis hypogaea TaxID=3818 RepID=UPI000DEC6E31|nr:ribonuclease 1-like [Arachis hypogaea]QHO03358.1 Ribonuclease [Arachis hypogaea]